MTVHSGIENMAIMRIDILSTIPGIVEGPLGFSIPHRAQKKGLVEIHTHDLRDYSTDKHRKVDDYPFGGGSGMVLKPEPIFACIDALNAATQAEGSEIDDVILLTPDGNVFNQRLANELSLKRHLVLIAGHYKGVDQRVRDHLVTREISVGDYVLSGGELPALLLVDALVRLIPGVLGDATSALSDSFQNDLLDAPVYTRPAIFRGLEVPDILLAGDHSRVRSWREAERVRKTRERRPDLLRRQ